jgi:uncharacterized membrane protein
VTRPGRAPGILLLALLGAGAAGLIAGYALKAQCTNKVWDGIQYRRSCYSDVLPLYSARGLDRHQFPYLDTDLEYPVGTGLYVGIVGKATSTAASFVAANAVGLALMGLGTVAVLSAMALDPRRVLLFAFGPALVLYAFHNWDLLAVGLVAFGMYAFWRGSDAWAGFFFGVGAATKLYPAFLLPAFGLAAFRRDRRSAIRMGIAFVLGLAMLNVPFMLANFHRWWFPWKFQSERFTNYETSWFMIFRHFLASKPEWFSRYPSVTNVASLVLFIVGAALLLTSEARRERVRPYALGFGMLVVFLLTAKVFSPQYALWLLPFFALLRMPWYSYVAFAVTDAAVWFAVSGYFLAVQYHTGDPGWRLGVLEVTVWARYAVLAWLLWLSRRTEELVRAPRPERDEAAAVPLTA